MNLHMANDNPHNQHSQPLDKAGAVPEVAAVAAAVAALEVPCAIPTHWMGRPVAARW